MGKKRAIKDLWIALFAIIGAILILFSSNLGNRTVSITIGVILVIVSIFISLSKAWS